MPAYERALRQLHSQKCLQDLDLHFALFLMSQTPTAGELAALTFALVSHATSQGHVCLDLRSLSGQGLLPEATMQMRAPSVAVWRDLLLASGVVGQPGDWQPLILDAGDRLYLHRYWAYEQALGRSMLNRSDGLMADIDEARLSSGLDLLFGPAPEGMVDWQRIASATAVLRRLTIISGGPGTGKTTTVVRILALLREQPGGGGLRIALAAPTGMAASRLQQSIHQAKCRLPLAADALEAIPEQAMTLHRLLGVGGQGTGYRHHRDNPLPLDVLVLDEASMVDVAMMARLLEALPEAARLILLGDRDQLASVEAGAVLGDLCAGCEGADSAFVERLGQVSKLALSDASPASRGALRNSVVVLRHSYRFDRESPIGRLAAAVNLGDAQAAETLLRTAPIDAGIGWLEEAPSLANLAAQRYADLLRQIAEGAPVEQLFKTLQGYRVLCALRSGPFGAERLNLAITRRLQMMGLAGPEEAWFPGRPVMLTRNDYQLGLYNGDTGIVLPHPENPRQLAVAFAAGDGQTRWVAPARLPGCETVFAMTVHKSQGSEFGQVALQLPDQLSPVLCRELIYTAITRAREGFYLAGSAAVFRESVSRRLGRHSGLVDLLDQESGPGA